MILEEETYKKFGYYPSKLKPKSGKKILAACDDCGKIREVKKADYRAFCLSCKEKGERNPLFGKIHSEETRERISQSLNGKMKGENNPFYGKHHTEEAKQKMREKQRNRSIETREKMSRAQKGKSIPEETRKKISEANKGERNYMYGKCHSEKARQKMSENHPDMRGAKNPHYGKRHTEEVKQKMRELRKRIRIPTHHTKIELIFGAFAEKFGIGAEYTGDAKFWIGRINPDFIILSMKIAIFINGDYWHSPLLRYNIGETQQVDFQIAECKKHKWKAIIIWGTDLLREDAETFVLALLKKEGVI